MKRFELQIQEVSNKLIERAIQKSFHLSGSKAKGAAKYAEHMIKKNKSDSNYIVKNRKQWNRHDELMGQSNKHMNRAMRLRKRKK